MHRFAKYLTVALGLTLLVGCQPTTDPSDDSTTSTTVTTSTSVTVTTASSTEVTETQLLTETQTTEDSEATTPSTESLSTPVETAESTLTPESTATTESTASSTETPPEETEMNVWERHIRQPIHYARTVEDPLTPVVGIESINMLGLITGDGSPNQTRTRFLVGGTDLGIPVVHNDRLYLWFGDTMYGSLDGRPMEGGLWRSNVLAISDDRDASDGLDIDDMIGTPHDDFKMARELVYSMKVPGEEHTVIPTGSVSVNGKLYVYFMSIKEWGPPGEWTINYGGLAVSDDDGESFTKIEDIKLNGEISGQVGALQVDDMIYAVTIGGGRRGDGYLMRVPATQIESMEAYEYLTGLDGETPQWGPAEDAIAIIERQVGETSLMYNDYLEAYVVTYLDEARAEVVMRTAPNVWGPWSNEITLASSRDYPGLYGGFMHEWLTKDDGQTFYFIMSQWDPIYNSILFEVNLKDIDK